MILFFFKYKRESVLFEISTLNGLIKLFTSIRPILSFLLLNKSLVVMSETDDVCRSVLTEIEESLAQIKLMPLIPFPVYESKCFFTVFINRLFIDHFFLPSLTCCFYIDTNKAAAYISYRLKDYESVAYYLSEAHGGGIRSKLTLTVNPEWVFNNSISTENVIEIFLYCY